MNANKLIEFFSNVHVGSGYIFCIIDREETNKIVQSSTDIIIPSTVIDERVKNNRQFVVLKVINKSEDVKDIEIGDLVIAAGSIYRITIDPTDEYSAIFVLRKENILAKWNRTIV